MSRRRRRTHTFRPHASTEARCPVTNKASYRNRVAAIAARSRVIADWQRLGQNGDKTCLYVYRCPLDECRGRWHLTSMNPATYVPLRNRTDQHTHT